MDANACNVGPVTIRSGGIAKTISLKEALVLKGATGKIRDGLDECVDLYYVLHKKENRTRDLQRYQWRKLALFHIRKELIEIYGESECFDHLTDGFQEIAKKYNYSPVGLLNALSRAHYIECVEMFIEFSPLGNQTTRRQYRMNQPP